MSRLTDFLLDELRRIPKGDVGKRADLAGVSREQLTRWRRGKLPLNPTLQTLERLVAVLGLKLVLKEAEQGQVVAESEVDYVSTDESQRTEIDALRRRVRKLEKAIDG